MPRASHHNDLSAQSRSKRVLLLERGVIMLRRDDQCLTLQAVQAVNRGPRLQCPRHCEISTGGNRADYRGGSPAQRLLPRLGKEPPGDQLCHTPHAEDADKKRRHPRLKPLAPVVDTIGGETIDEYQTRNAVRTL
jgi:hypothetical protein